ncbi:SDR family NAD(P)-dependent oxidoreductase [Hoeflea sp.]|uniref:SDR family NAD(P)-dependent oxidoreductase n=1 Tax=Hoeflea sp. TaxID=1940281 RepID=UPI00374881A6
MRLDGRTAIVTGGAKGIGLAIVRRLASEGARVMIADIDEAAGVAAVEAASGDGDVRFTATDVSERLDVHNLVAKTIDAFGAINALVNNAGIVHAADFLDLEEADFDRVMSVNLKSAFLCGQAVARHMVEQIAAGDEPGSIVNMSSINDTFAIANQVPYSVSKGGVSQLTKVMALSLASHGIRVNAVGPGSIMTDLLASVAENPDARSRILSRTPLGRIGEPAEIAAVTAFLLSGDASYVTGQTIYADGGRMPLNYTVPVKE